MQNPQWQICRIAGLICRQVTEVCGSMDVLTDVLRAMRLSGGVFLDAEFTEPWCTIAKVAPEDCRPFIAEFPLDRLSLCRALP
jgi:hypothetical protein